jgi:hypothetical protein
MTTAVGQVAVARKVEEAVQARVAALSEAVAALADGVTVQSGGVTAPADGVMAQLEAAAAPGDEVAVLVTAAASSDLRLFLPQRQWGEVLVGAARQRKARRLDGGPRASGR